MKSQAEKGSIFRSLHQQDEAFIIPNPWDIGTAYLLEQVGFQALATTSAGYAFSIAKRDGAVTREAMMRHAAEISSATHLPVSADLESGFGDTPEIVAETIQMGAAAGLVGASIEDMVHGREARLYEISIAAERVAAAVEAARALDFAFTLTARCENYLIGNPDLDDTIRRLLAYQEAGADVLYAPGVSRIEDIAKIVEAVDRPINVLAGGAMTQAALSAAGVKRISVGSALSRAALGEFLRAAKEMKDGGTFSYVDHAISYPEISSIFPPNE